ncbi:PilZ domain-containing protein [Rhizorhabdus dicambivorans]|uniref:PilZ domain-containing protein n=1 Tax=Rhizorhabdus dicambivorans TaxID=1850238 RepID=A0A2A4FU19_9SPHN|nr:PilZ domain-containing protein [Rhizorhabdus dicambivorans]ATE67243.1 PilZ domain-containing protein [Rhizorhabdus dicambivorans]PCE41667.1 PilZ domain-containing protein [Rhizorhabdus dicambivorans]
MIEQAYRPSERRQSLRLAIDHRSNLRLTLDGAETGTESIHGVTLTDISRGGLMAAGAGQLVPGAFLTLEVPLVGWREGEVVWIADNRAGCRFLQPLSLEELALAAAHSDRLAAECPELAAQIAEIAAGAEARPDAAIVEETVTSRPHRHGWVLPSAILAAALFGIVLTLALALLLA